jgi:DNA invertase Pin-like site-specific DNA recombinase
VCSSGKLDRLVRRPKDFERLWVVAERRGVFIASVTEPVDSSSPIGLAMLRILVALAGLESATTGIRVRGPNGTRPRRACPRRSRPTGSHRGGTASLKAKRPCYARPPVE